MRIFCAQKLPHYAVTFLGNCRLAMWAMLSVLDEFHLRLRNRFLYPFHFARFRSWIQPPMQKQRFHF